MLFAALKNITLPHPDAAQQGNVNANIRHSRAILALSQLLRSMTLLFQRCYLNIAAGDAQSREEWAAFMLALKQFNGVTVLLSATNVLLDGLSTRKASTPAGVTLPGPGGFAVARAAAAIVSCCTCSEENALAIAGCSGVSVLASMLRFVREFEVGRHVCACGVACQRVTVPHRCAGRVS